MWQKRVQVFGSVYFSSNNPEKRIDKTKKKHSIDVKYMPFRRTTFPSTFRCAVPRDRMRSSCSTAHTLLGMTYRVEIQYFGGPLHTLSLLYTPPYPGHMWPNASWLPQIGAVVR
ncbi:hypothetical protein C8J57DRAFT_1212257 [Mycena rebaudengoi]|nr:hypothetical protein C8J57DRAFT_1212257 [Mycena rebaudengoi]